MRYGLVANTHGTDAVQGDVAIDAVILCRHRHLLAHTA